MLFRPRAQASPVAGPARRVGAAAVLSGIAACALVVPSAGHGVPSPAVNSAGVGISVAAAGSTLTLPLVTPLASGGGTASVNLNATSASGATVASIAASTTIRVTSRRGVDRLMVAIPKSALPDLQAGAQVRVRGVVQFNRGGTSAPSRTTSRVDSVITTTTARPIVVRALGDSVTAGFGWIGNTTDLSTVVAMTAQQNVDGCGTLDPDENNGEQLNDRCSSNSALGAGSLGQSNNFLADYGLANGMAWPSQVVRNLGGMYSTSYANRGVTGADPLDLLPLNTPATDAEKAHRSDLTSIIQDTINDAPDITLMTIGANPLLGRFSGGKALGCLVIQRDDLFRACALRVIKVATLTPRVSAVIRQILDGDTNKKNHLVVSLYPTVLPANIAALGRSDRSARPQIATERTKQVLAMINKRIRAAARSQPEYGSRLFVSTPPLQAYGVAPGRRQCPTNAKVTGVDGASTQSAITQRMLAGSTDARPFCRGAQHWSISSDGGVHPTRAGHAELAGSASDLILAKGIIPPA